MSAAHRIFAAAMVAGLTGQLTAQTPRQQARGYVQVAERIAPRVHLLRQAEPNFAGVVGNTVVIEQRDGLVLIDVGASHGSGERIVELVRGISKQPVKAVVLTHWHGDHHLGLSAIVAAWPDVAIISHRNAAADIDTLMKAFPRAQSAAYEAERIRSLGANIDQLVAERLASPATPEERAGWQAALVGNRALRFADVAGTRLVLPNRTLTDTLTLADADVPVELRYLGRANTTGDIVAWLPRQRILATGDVVVEPTPFMISVFPTDLLRSIENIRAIPFDVLLPGHGLPQRDRALLDRITTLVRDALNQVTPLARAGLSLDTVTARVDLSRHRAGFAGKNAWLQFWFSQYTATPLIESVYREVEAQARASMPSDSLLIPSAKLEAFNTRPVWTDYRGRRALQLAPLVGQEQATDQEMWVVVSGTDFTNGVIEVDIAGARRKGYAEDNASAFKGFVGVSFRVRGDTAERFYLRTENARLDDQLFRNRTTQYEAPPDALWQVLRRDSPGVYESYADVEAGAWTTLRIEVAGKTARLFINGSPQPALVVTDLKHGESRGAIALWTRISADAYFSNLRVTPR
jgi:glyoxylase-like metal-dependent hydrolase (beta-lactamase superfamily II)